MSSLPPPPPPPVPPVPPGGNFAPPPGYVPYGAGGQRGFEAIRAITKWLTILLAVSAATQVLSVLTQIGLRGEVVELSNGLDGLTGGFAVYLLVSLAAGAVGLAVLVLEVIFAYRIAKNLRILGRTMASFGPGATIATVILGSCTLGILPYFMWRELWAGSEPSMPAHAPEWKQAPVAAIVTQNLVLSIVSTLAGLVAGGGAAFLRIGSTNSNDLADRLDNGYTALIVSGFLTAAATLVLMQLVRQLGARHMMATREP